MAKQGDWKKILLAVAGAAAVLVVSLAALATAGFVWATTTAGRLGAPVPEPVTRTIAVRTTGVGPFSGASGAEPFSGASSQPLHLDVELQDGEFDLLPGPPGAGVRVDGTYAKAYYTLTEEHVPAGEPGGPATRIRLRRAQSFWVLLAAHAIDGTRGAPNSLTVTIPRETPIALTLKLHTGESRIDLGGLTLTELDAELSMGEHRLDFSAPLAGRLRRMRVDGGMGEIRIDRLGNARPMALEAAGRMASLTADLGGDWSGEDVADLTFDGTMAELRIDVPDGVRIAADSETSAVLGESGRIPAGTAAASEAPHVRLHLSTTMGEARVRRY